MENIKYVTYNPPDDFNELYPWKGMRRCIVNPDTTVAYYLDANNSNLKEDGTAVNWSEIENLGQNCMVEIPKFYSSKVAYESGFRFLLSDKPEKGLVVHPAFFRDRDGDGVAEEVDFRYFGAFLGWKDSQNRLRSLPNKKPTVSQTIGVFRTQAEANGVGWGLCDFNLQYAVQVLYLIEYGHFDSQTKIGRGFVDENTASANTGGTLQYGNSTFGETTGKQQMSYRGIEDWWGNLRQWFDGCYYYSGAIKIGNVNFNDTGAGYESYPATLPEAGGSISNIFDGFELGFIPNEFKGSNYTNYLYDYGIVASGRLPYLHSYWTNGSSAGAFALNSYAASYSISSLGGRLVL